MTSHNRFCLRQRMMMASSAAMLLALAAAPAVAVTSCTAAQSIFTSSTSATNTLTAECPGGLGVAPCANTSEHPDAIYHPHGYLSQCIEAGYDPPVAMRSSGRGTSANFTGMAAATQTGQCTPTATGIMKCPVYNTNPSGNSTIVPSWTPTPMAGLNIPPIQLSPNTNITLNTALPCGGAVPLSVGPVSIGGVTISVPTPPVVTNAVNTINNILGGGGCGGSTINLLQSLLYLVVPGATTASGAPTPTMSISNGSLTVPSTSSATASSGAPYISVPAGTPVGFNVQTQGSITLPEGGTFADPTTGTVYTIPVGGAIISLGGGQVQIPNQAPGAAPGSSQIVSLNSSVSSININTTAVQVPPGTQLPVNTTATIQTPQITACDPATSPNGCATVTPPTVTTTGR